MVNHMEELALSFIDLITCRRKLIRLMTVLPLKVLDYYEG